VAYSGAPPWRDLLAAPQDVCALHGDLHHGNVLDFKERGWLAIDPKGLIGDRGFDFANIFCNPDLGIAANPGWLARQAGVVATAAHLDRTRLESGLCRFVGGVDDWRRWRRHPRIGGRRFGGSGNREGLV
jgi:streptomycin 6-kinase